MKHQDALDQLARETSLAKQRLAIERGLRAGFVLLAGIGAWALLALIGVLGALPPLAQSLAAIAALCLFTWLALRAVRAWRAPTEEEARARLAADSRLDAGAFDSLRDQPTRFDAFSVALWKRDRERALELVERARAAPFRTGLDERDPFKLRFALIVALLGGLAIAGANAPERLTRAFLPDPGPLIGDQPMAIEAWATPADYTHAPPVSLSDLIGERVETPPSIDATVRVSGPVGPPVLVFDGQGGHRAVRLRRAADGAWEGRLRIPGRGRLRVVRFHTAAAWRISPAADRAPTASFASPIAQLPEERASIRWRAADDFGVRKLILRVRPLNPPPGLVRADPVDTLIDTPAGDPRRAEATTQIELAAHPYAGMEVEARIVAVDALGQEGVSDPLQFTLPEKVFLQPLARAAIEIRRHILAERRAYTPPPPQQRRTIPAGDILLGNQRIEIRDDSRRPNLQRAPDGVRRAARLLDALTTAPEDGYFRDLAVYLGFRYARAQLDRAGAIGETDLAADILWRTALRAEYGGAADARRALEEAQRQLSEALAQGAPQERIRQLMDALRQATENYMQALIQDAMRNGGRQNMDDTQEQTQLSERDIQDLMEQVQRLAEQGRMAEAQQMLQMLANILNNMDVQLSQSESAGGQPDNDDQMQQSVDQLSRTMGEQRALRDETRQQQQEQSGGQQPGSQGGDALAERQAQIRQGLAQAQRMADESGAAPSEDLNAAGEAMRQAENALRQGDLDRAATAQSAALDRLRQGAETLGAELRQRGRENGQQRGDTGGQRDPLGRPTGGAGQIGDETRVPSEMSPMRAREIFDEIRRRAQDPNRPATEREYLQRLLDRFGESGS